MFLVGLFSWWYGGGWRARLGAMARRFEATTDFFSITLLLQTLFAPFRQISAGQASGSLGTQARAFVDRTISRLIGAVARIGMIIIGSIAIIFQTIIGLCMLLIWPIIPLLPVVGVVMAIIGWVPSW